MSTIKRRTSLKILAITEYFPSPYKPYHYTQFERFVLDGHELTVCAFHRLAADPGERATMEFVQRVKYVPATLRDLTRDIAQAFKQLLQEPTQTLRRGLRAATRKDSAKQRLLNFRRAISMPSKPPDICIVHNLRAAVNVQFLKAIYPSATIAMYYHGGELPGVPVPSGADIRHTFGAFDLVFTNTESSKRHAIARGQLAERTIVSPVGFNLELFPDPVGRAYRRDDKLNVLMVGRLGMEKGFIFGLQALTALLAEGLDAIVMRIVGDGPQEALLKQYVVQHDLSRKVEFLGRVSQQQLLDCYRGADVFLLPSIAQGTWEENQACVVQEAMLMRGVAAVSRTGGVPESTAPQMLKYSFEPASVASIADSLRRLSKLSLDELSLLGSQGRAFVEQRYDIRVLNRELLLNAFAFLPPAPVTAVTHVVS